MLDKNLSQSSRVNPSLQDIERDRTVFWKFCSICLGFRKIAIERLVEVCDFTAQELFVDPEVTFLVPNIKIDHLCSYEAISYLAKTLNASQ
jgi:hypothetical protein